MLCIEQTSNVQVSHIGCRSSGDRPSSRLPTFVMHRSIISCQQITPEFTRLVFNPSGSWNRVEYSKRLVWGLHQRLTMVPYIFSNTLALSQSIVGGAPTPIVSS